MKALRTFAAVTALFLTLTACKKDHDHGPVIAGYGPMANFSVAGGDCGAPCTVTFTNTSANSVSYTWNFGDGSPESDASTGTVSHLYEQPGTYKVILTATAGNGTTSGKALSVVIAEDVAGNMLTAKTFRLSAIEVTFQGQIIDGFTFYPECQKDDTHKFNQGGEYVITDAGMMCAPPSSATGTWAFNDDQTQITLNGQVLEVVSMSENTLVLKASQGLGGSAVFTYQAI